MFQDWEKGGSQSGLDPDSKLLTILSGEVSSVGIPILFRLMANPWGNSPSPLCLYIFSLTVRTRRVTPATYTHPHSYVKRYESRKASSGSPRSRKSDQIRASSWDSVYENRTEEICSRQRYLSWRGEGLRAVAEGVCCADATAAVKTDLRLFVPTLYMY